MENKNKYWKGIEELNREPEFVQLSKNEFAEGLPLEEVLNDSDLSLSSNRRDFLKFFGFSVSAVALAACNKAPVKNVIPYVIKPETITPGIPNYYASTWNNTPVVVKTREGRPIKLEGNEKSTISQGGLDAQGHASVVSLYDNKRLPVPLKKGKTANWSTLDKEIKAKLGDIAAKGGQVRLVTGHINSPMTQSIINEFKTAYPTAQHVVYNPVNNDGMILANEACFGKAVIPGYRFENADVIVSFGADFLGTWLNSIQYSKDYIKKRVPTPENKTMSRHIQFESMLSLTGSNADYRFPMKDSQEGLALISLYNELAKGLGTSQLATPNNLELAGNAIGNTAKALLGAKGKSIIISKSNDVNVQSMVNQINLMLGNYGTTIDMDNYYLAKNTGTVDFEQFVKEMDKVAAVIFYNTNPVYSHRDGKKIADRLQKMELAVSTAYYNDETAAACEYVAPDLHFLESWNVTEISAGQYSFTQPTIAPVFETRQAQESLALWSGNPAVAAGKFDVYEYTKSFCQKNIFPLQSQVTSFNDWWNTCLHEGIFDAAKKGTSIPANNVLASNLVAALDKKAADAGIELVLYTKVGVGDGADGNNPWLHEMPDPISKVCWDNYLSLPKITADELGLKQGDVANVTFGGVSIESIPVLVQPGQARNTAGIALGYGRTSGVKETIGKNAFPFVSVVNGTASYFVPKIDITKAAGAYELAQTQTHHSIEGRDIVRETTLEEYIKKASSGNVDHAAIKDKNHNLYTLWEEKEYKQQRWGMAIDMNACTGCGACVVSCSLENNVPVVGRDEVRRRREMHWIRIDRYYSFKNENNEYVTKEKEYDDLTTHENVTVVHQPMLCQHCGHAPCETVCPVLATTHSSDGLNQMTYNRCIGTKYCANNCPYKVRRFNWFRYNDNDKFDYYMNNDLGKMVINPDVTVRTRGVMEKCSMCVQRIQSGKLKAKLEGRKLEDGEIQTACSQSCPANAIVFGDMNDANSRISKLFRNERAYEVLEEINVQSSIRYLTRIRNTDEKPTVSAHH